MYPSIPVPHNLNTTYDYGFLRGIAGFMTGMIVYKLYQWSSLQEKYFIKIYLHVTIIL